MKARKMTALLVLALSALLILTACTPIMSDDAAESAEAGDGTQAQEHAVLIMATDASFPPYEFSGEVGITGIDIEIAGKVAEKLGMELQVKNMAFNDIISAVQNKQADIGMAALTADETRLAVVNFTASYTTSRQVIIVHKDPDVVSPADLNNSDVVSPAELKDSDITSPADLAGKRIGVLQGTPASIYCTEEFGEAAITTYTSSEEAAQALLHDNVDAVVIDDVPAKALAQIDENLVVLDNEYKHDDFAIAVNTDNTSLLKKINSALAELKASGEIQGIVSKYINAE